MSRRIYTKTYTRATLTAAAEATAAVAINSKRNTHFKIQFQIKYHIIYNGGVYGLVCAICNHPKFMNDLFYFGIGLSTENTQKKKKAIFVTVFSARFWKIQLSVAPFDDNKQKIKTNFFFIYLKWSRD